MAKKKQKQAEPVEDDKKVSNEVRKWLTRIEYAQRYKKKISEKYHWERLIEEYRGYFAGLQDSMDIYIPSLNDIFAYVKSEIPALYLRDPKIKCNPKKGSSILSSKILEKALNYLWRTKRIKRENRKNIFDVLLVGHSWFKSGYTGKFGAVEDGNGNTFEFIESEDFFGYRVPYSNITFNPDSNDPPYDCTWIAHEVYIPLDELQANKTFQNTNKIQATVMTDYDTGNKDPLADRNRFDPDLKMAKVYEVWDKKSQTVFTIAAGVDEYLREPKKWPYEMRGFPFSFLRFNDDLMCPYGIPDCFMFEQLVIERMKIRGAEFDHLKRFNRQLLLAKGHMDQDAKDQYSQAITGAVIEVNTQGQPLSNIVSPIPYPPLPSDIYAIEDRTAQDIINISGQSNIDRGGTQKTSTRSLGELEEIRKGGQNRRSDKIDLVEDFIEDIAHNQAALLQQLADQPFFIKIAGDDQDGQIEGLASRPSSQGPGAVTQPNGFTFTKEDIQGEFDFEVVAGSTTPLDHSQIMQILDMMLATLQKAQIPPGPIHKYIFEEIADELDMPGLKKAVLEQEQQLAAQQQAAQQAQEQQQQLMTGQAAAEMQIKAEREATKQMQVQLQAHQQFNPQKEEAPKEEATKVSESISFKDLPPEGAVQMAAQAGITITTDQVAKLQEQARQALDAKAKAKQTKGDK